MTGTTRGPRAVVNPVGTRRPSVDAGPAPEGWQRLIRRVRWLVWFTAGAGCLLLLLLLLTPIVADDGDHAATTTNLVLFGALISGLGLVVGVSLVTGIVIGALSETLPHGAPDAAAVRDMAQASVPQVDAVAEFLARRPLPERKICQAVLDGGGSHWQSELAAECHLTPSTVSRALDRLAGDEMLERVREGMSNRVILGPRLVHLGQIASVVGSASGGGTDKRADAG